MAPGIPAGMSTASDQVSLMDTSIYVTRFTECNLDNVKHATQALQLLDTTRAQSGERGGRKEVYNLQTSDVP